MLNMEEIDPNFKIVRKIEKEDIVFYDVQVKKEISDDGEYCEITYDEMSLEDGMEALDGGFGFIWFNDYMEIEKFTYLGEIINWV